MTYVALLRGINVGGKRTVEMKRLKAAFEHAGMERVRTYINSGNVVFGHVSKDAVQLLDVVERAIEKEFGFPVQLLIRDAAAITSVADALPDTWANDQAARCDVMFLFDEIDGPEILQRLTIKPDIDDVRYVPGALLWRVERANVTRSGMRKLLGTDLYRKMTMRNCNTLRKLAELARQADAAED